MKLGNFLAHTNDFFKKAKTPATLIIIALFSLLVILTSYFHLLDIFELQLLDMRFRLRAPQTVNQNIVFIEIDDATLNALGQFPLPRKYYALLINALKENQARYVFFDITFNDASLEENDSLLSEAIKQAGNVYLPYSFYIDKKALFSVPSAARYATTVLEQFGQYTRGEGHINIIPDIDGKYRRVPLYIKHDEALYPYISFLIGLEYLGIDEKKVRVLPGKYLDCGKGLTIPLDEKSTHIINFSGNWSSTYQHVSFSKIISSYLASAIGQEPAMNLDFFKDKICIVCLTATGTIDLHPNPFDSLYPAAGLHAELINSMINKKFISRVPPTVNVGLLILVSFLIALVSLKTKPVKGFLFSILMVIAFNALGFLIFNVFGLWIDLFVPSCVAFMLYAACNLYKYISEWKRRLLFEKELDIAKRIQLSFLPKELPKIAGLDIAATMFTAKEVGGDLYDFVEFGPDKLGVMIGDVSGKGIPASLFMSMVVGTFDIFSAQDPAPENTLYNLNAKLSAEASSNLFVTVLYSIIDVKNMTLTCANGGHMPLLHVTAQGESQYLDVDEGMPLGVIEGPYSQKTISVHKGDTFVFYTDGITEATNPKGAMYGKDRLIDIVSSKKFESAALLIDAIEKDVRKFEPAHTQHDDMTIIVIKLA